MALFPAFSEPCCRSASGSVLLVVHQGGIDEYDFCYDIPEEEFPAIAARLDELTGTFSRLSGIWRPGRLALRTIRLCDGCGRNEEVVSFEISPGRMTEVQGDILRFLDGRGLVRRGEVWSVE